MRELEQIWSSMHSVLASWASFLPQAITTPIDPIQVITGGGPTAMAVLMYFWMRDREKTHTENLKKLQDEILEARRADALRQEANTAALTNVANAILKFQEAQATAVKLEQLAELVREAARAK